jgi:Ca2+/Na+ antiporter
MNPIAAIGIAGSLLLVIGAAWPDTHVSHPVRSVKNWLLAVGGWTMFAYAIGNYLAGGSVFFVILEILVVLASILMLIDVPDRIDIPLLSTTGVALIAWSFFLFEGYDTVLFILGLTGVGIGYALETGSVRRDVALLLGSGLITFFSYLQANQIYFWLNLFFALFSAYNVYTMTSGRQKKTPLAA